MPERPRLRRTPGSHKPAPGPPTTTTDIAAPGHGKPIRLAHAALLAAVDLKWARAERLLARLNAECPGPGIGDALVAWCDALLEHGWGGPVPLGARGRVAHLNADTGALDQANEITPARDWAARLIAARAAGDLPAFEALLAEMNAIGDGWARGRYATALLTGAAMTIRVLPRGHARIGAS